MLVVKKFGGTSVGNKERIMNVAKRCIEDYKKGNDVVVVLSAIVLEIYIPSGDLRELCQETSDELDVASLRDGGPKN